MPIIAIPTKHIVPGVGVGLGSALAVGAGVGLALAAIQGANTVVHEAAKNPVVPWFYKVNTDTRKLEKLDRIIQNTSPATAISPEEIEKQQRIDAYRRQIMDQSPAPKPRGTWSPIDKDESL